MSIENLLTKKIPNTGKKAKHKRWLQKNPEYVVKRLKRWIDKEKNPVELKRAKFILKKYLDKFPEK
jgi:elongation factor P--beta-lysine ligase